MEMPRPREEHRKLEALAGTWTGKETMFPSPWDAKGGPATGRVVSRLELDGFFLITDYTQERGGQVSYRGHGVFGWDASQKTYTMDWFDSMGTPAPGPARGKWEGNTLIFQMTSPMGHARYTYTFEGEGRYGFQIDHSQDGDEWTRFMEGSYARE